MTQRSLGWIGIVRLGIVQTALGSIVVLTTSTLNRIMVVELALPALIPGALVALHYGIQLLRPRFGYGSDVGGRRSPWIVGGIAILAMGGISASVATAMMGSSPYLGLGLAVLSFTLIGIGVGAAGTALLALLASHVDANRRPAAATIVWLMMIAGFVVTAIMAGEFLDPYSPARLIAVTSVVAVTSFVVALLAVARIEGPAASLRAESPVSSSSKKLPFREALAQIWHEREARYFTIFVFISMLAYSAQDLILEPFAGAVFGMTPGESTKLSGVQHGGVFAGMILVAILGSISRRGRFGSLREYCIAGCIASAGALGSLAFAAGFAPHWPLQLSVFCLGFANGVFAVAAIGSMMALAGKGRESREGTRVGLWGAAQAVAFGLGGVTGAGAVDLFRALLGDTADSFAIVFAGEAGLFLLAALLAARISGVSPGRVAAPRDLGADRYAAGFGER